MADHSATDCQAPTSPHKATASAGRVFIHALPERTETARAWRRQGQRRAGGEARAWRRRTLVEKTPTLHLAYLMVYKMVYKGKVYKPIKKRSRCKCLSYNGLRSGAGRGLKLCLSHCELTLSQLSYRPGPRLSFYEHFSGFASGGLGRVPPHSCENDPRTV